VAFFLNGINYYYYCSKMAKQNAARLCWALAICVWATACLGLALYFVIVCNQDMEQCSSRFHIEGASLDPIRYSIMGFAGVSAFQFLLAVFVLSRDCCPNKFGTCAESTAYVAWILLALIFVAPLAIFAWYAAICWMAFSLVLQQYTFTGTMIILPAIGTGLFLLSLGCLITTSCCAHKARPRGKGDYQGLLQDPQTDSAF
jgi:hypothetical protein